jgi:hypothetical protein
MSGEFNHIAQRKPFYPIGPGLREYLNAHGRDTELPVTYADLRRYDGLMPVLDANGKETLWNTVLLRHGEIEDIHRRLVQTYQLLIADGSHIGHLAVASIDFCAYGNSQPFRIKILNTRNDNHDYYYIKQADASRVYGLELEHLLSPNRINYACRDGTIVEEHIIGVPGDVFINDPARYGGLLHDVRLSKEFIKFNERCFVRLLGDMRAYNFVVDVIHDLDQVQYRIRAIDFDQQCFEGRARIYLPQFYKENLPYVQLAQNVVGKESLEQYRNEERALLRKRYKLAQDQVDFLLEVLAGDVVSTPDHLGVIAADLDKVHGTREFAACTNMGQVLTRHLRLALEPETALRLP